MNPKHHNPTRLRRDKNGREFWARAPYNFVSLPEKVVVAETAPPQDQYYAEPSRYTGRIECALTTESPLYTRAALNPDFFQQWAENSREMMKKDSDREKYAHFFHLDDAQRPVIPGSSLRGMVRSLIEIVGYGKMRWVTKDRLFFRAVADSSSLGRLYRDRMKQSEIRAGYLRRTSAGWEIIPAKPIAGRAFAQIHQSEVRIGDLASWKDCSNAWTIQVEIPHGSGPRVLPLVRLATARPNYEAVLIKTGQMEGKNKDFVFGLPNEQARAEMIPENVRHIYLQDAQKAMFPENDILRDMQPVFYLLKDGQLDFFGHTMMFRLPYPHSPFDLVSSHLHSADGLDLAEAIFGYTPEGSRKEGKAGRVFFTDAYVEPTQNDVWLSNQPITPTILSSPKPTTFQHYLTQQKPDDKGQLDHYGSPPPHETVIRGHKLYWHKGTVGLGELTEKDPVDWSTDTQRTQIKPVKAGVTFHFRIQFENLSNVELGALLWVLTLPGETGTQYRHKLGMGKPLGMGSVKITPTLYLSNRQGRYSRLFEGDTWHQAERVEPDIQSFLHAFEEYVLAGMDGKERGGVKSLKEVERIRMFLKMLEWPGPDRQLTEYMRIGEPVNEYKERPVLSDPLNIKRPTPTSTTMPRSDLRKGKGGNQKGRQGRCSSSISPTRSLQTTYARSRR